MSSVIRGSDNFDTNNAATDTELSNALSNISSSTLTKSLPLASGGSVTANKAVSLTTDGEVGKYPSVHTTGTSQNTRVYVMSTDGSCGLTLSSVTNSSYTTLTTTGHILNSSGAITATGTPLNTNTSFPSSYTTKGGSYKAYALSTNKFIVFQYAYGRYYDGQYDTGTYSDLRIMQVDASGNVSQLTSSAMDYSNTNSLSTPNYGMTIYRIGNLLSSNTQVFFTRQYRAGGTAYRTVTVNPDSNSITYSTDNEAQNMTAIYGGVFCNSNSVISTLYGNTNYYASYSTNNVGTVSSSSISLPLYASGGKWHYVSDTLAICHYTDINSVGRFATASVNTSGIWTVVDNALMSLSEWESYVVPSIIISQNGTNIVAIRDGLFITFEIDIAGNITKKPDGTIKTGTPLNIPEHSSIYSAEFVDTDVVWVQYTNTSASEVLVPITITSYISDAFVFAGFSVSTSSSGNQDIVLGGIVDGFTGLLPTSKYYIDVSIYDGSITTNNIGAFVGTAISSTELLIGGL